MHSVVTQQDQHAPDRATTLRPGMVIRHPRRITIGLVASALIAGLIVAVFANAVISAPVMDWGVVWDNLFSKLVLTGVLHTVELTVVCEALAIVSAAVLAYMLVSGNIVWRMFAHGYQWFFRSVPELAQLIFWFNLSLVFPTLNVGIPFGGTSFGSVGTNQIITPWLAAVVGIGLHEGAYLAEVFRAGINSVSIGQREAARALGLTPRRVFRRIVLPQAMWVIVPNAGSRLIGTLKLTSLASVLAISELLYTVENIFSRTLQTIPLLMVATAWYMTMVGLLRLLQYVLERHYAAAAHRGERSPRGGRKRDRVARAHQEVDLAEVLAA
jgi:polar amino acid transport system permease protein